MNTRLHLILSYLLAFVIFLVPTYITRVHATCSQSGPTYCGNGDKPGDTCHNNGGGSNGRACEQTSAAPYLRYCCHPYSCDVNCGLPGGGTGGGCSTSDPRAPTLLSPANNETCLPSQTVTLDWNDVDFATCCDGNDNTYSLFVDGVQLNASPIPAGTTQMNFTGAWGTTHTWYVVASNRCRTTSSATYTFTIGACTRIVGRMWTDQNGNGNFDGASEAWSHSPPASSNCAALLDNDIALYGNSQSLDITFGCNPVSYYYTDYISLLGPTGTTRRLPIQVATPDYTDYPSSYVQWWFTRNGVPIANGRGETTGGALDLTDESGIDWTNHLWYRFIKNRPPTATVSTGVSPQHSHTETIGGRNRTVYIVPWYENVYFSAAATDPPRPWENGAWLLAVSKQTLDPVTGVAPGGDTAFTNVTTSCSGNSCNVGGNHGDLTYGYHVFYPVAEDDIARSVRWEIKPTNSCSGHPGVHNNTYVSGNSFADCDPDWSNGFQDELIIRTDSRPVCQGVTGPSDLAVFENPAYPESIGFFNLRGTDADGTPTGHVFTPGWSNPYGVFPTIRSITISAHGTTAQGVGPILALYIGNNDNAGARTVRLYMGLNETNFTYTFPSNGSWGNVSSIDLVYVNNDETSPTEDRNAFVDWIDVTYDLLPGGPTATKRLYTYTMPNTGAVYYDRGSSWDTDAGIVARDNWFDGVDVLSINQSGGAGVLPWSGAISFPVPLRGPINTGAATVSGVAGNPLPFYSSTNSCNLSFNTVPGPTYTITGNLYATDPSLTCAAQNTNLNGPGKIEGARIRLFDELGAEIPGLTDTTDAGTGQYRIENVPLRYRRTSTCMNCGLQVCVDQLPDVEGTYLSACRQVIPTVGNANVSWPGTTFCTPAVVTDPQIAANSEVTVNLGLTFYQNEKWSVVADGDVYAPDVTFDIPESPTPNFAPYFINRRIDSGAGQTIGGLVFIDDLDMELGSGNPAEYSGYAYNLENSTGTYNFSDKWFADFNPVAPAQAVNTLPTGGNHYNFSSDRVYVYTRSEFNSWYQNASRTFYNVTGPRDVALIYVIGDPSAGETLNLNRSIRSNNPNDTVVLVTNLPVEVPDTLQVPEAQITTATYNINSSSDVSQANPLTTGYLDFVIISSDNIKIDSRFDGDQDPPITDLPLMVNGALISKTSVLLNRDLWHIYNTDNPAEMVRYYRRLLPELMEAETNNSDVSSYTGLSTFDIQTVYE